MIVRHECAPRVEARKNTPLDREDVWTPLEEVVTDEAVGTTYYICRGCGLHTYVRHGVEP